jgi:hypothetical protein
MDKLRMTDFCKKYNLPQYKLHRHLEDFDTVMVEGWLKPWIYLSEKNIILATKFSTLHNVRPKHPRLKIDEYMSKYKIGTDVLRNRWKSIKKEEINGEIYIADTRNNQRQIGVL